MSYRNDHDAALARIAALEDELEKVKSASPPVPVPAAVRRFRGRTLALAAAAAAAVASLGAVGILALPHVGRHKDGPPAGMAVVTEPQAATLRGCREAIVPVVGVDARTTDPHGSAPLAIAGIERGGARCRAELAGAATGNATYAAWLHAEDELAGDISRIVVYYGNDPYVLDGYSTAAQLWREYDRDVATRDALLPRVDRELGIVHPQS